MRSGIHGGLRLQALFESACPKGCGQSTVPQGHNINRNLEYQRLEAVFLLAIAYKAHLLMNKPSKVRLNPSEG